MKNLHEWFIHVPWGKLALVGNGHPDGDPVFLVHGRQDSSSVFEPLIEQMTGAYNFVALDMPGNGLSDAFPLVLTPDLCGGEPHYAVMYRRPPFINKALLDFERYSQGLEYTKCSPRSGPKLTKLHFLSAMELAINHLGWDRFIFIGHSMGCEQGLFYNVIHPGQITRMILLDAGPTLMRMQVEDHVEYQRYYDSYYGDYNWENFERKPYVREMALQALERHRDLTRNQGEIIIARNFHGFPFYKEHGSGVEANSTKNFQFMRLCDQEQNLDNAQSPIVQSLCDLRGVGNPNGCALEPQTPFSKYELLRFCYSEKCFDNTQPSFARSLCDLRLIGNPKGRVAHRTLVKKYKHGKNRFCKARVFIVLSSDIPRSIKKPTVSVVETKTPSYKLQLMLVYDSIYRSGYTKSLIVQTADGPRSIENPVGSAEPKTSSKKSRVLRVRDPNHRLDKSRSEKHEKKQLELLMALLLSKAEMEYNELEREEASTSGNESFNGPQNGTSTERKRKSKNPQTRQGKTWEPILIFRVLLNDKSNKELNEDEGQNAEAIGTQNAEQETVNVAPNPPAPGRMSGFIERMRRCGEVGYLSWDNRLKNLAAQNYGNDYYFALFKTIPPTLLIAASDGAKKVPPNPKWRQGVKELLNKMATLDNFHSVEVEGGHDVHFTHPERVVPYINAFLKDSKVFSKL